MVFILNTSTSLAQVEEKLRAALGADAHFGPARKVERIGNGSGMLSVVARVTADWTPKKNGLPDKFIVKIPSVSSYHSAWPDMSEDTVREMLVKAHNAEVAMYDAFASAESLPLCKVYHSSPMTETSEGLLIMESLDGIAERPLVEWYTVEEVEQVMCAYASIHAHILQHVNIASETSLREIYGDDRGLVKGHDTCLARFRSRRADDADFHALGEKVEGILPEVADLERYDRMNETLGLPRVLVHGDLHSGNVLFAREGGEGGKLKMRAVIDWQDYHYGLVAEDLAHCFFSLLSPTDRRAHWERLARGLYAQVEREMERVPYTVEELLLSYRHCAPTIALILLAYIEVGVELRVKASKLSASEVATVNAMTEEQIEGSLREIVQFYKETH